MHGGLAYPRSSGAPSARASWCGAGCGADPKPHLCASGCARRFVPVAFEAAASVQCPGVAPTLVRHFKSPPDSILFLLFSAGLVRVVAVGHHAGARRRAAVLPAAARGGRGLALPRQDQAGVASVDEPAGPRRSRRRGPGQGLPLHHVSEGIKQKGEQTLHAGEGSTTLP